MGITRPRARSAWSATRPTPRRRPGAPTSAATASPASTATGRPRTGSRRTSRRTGSRSARSTSAEGSTTTTTSSCGPKKCAPCHVEIDHEIVAGGHPPLQFELVAYAQIMKHWDDQDELPAGSFSLDPTIWSLGQIEGLRSALRMLARRATAQQLRRPRQVPALRGSQLLPVPSQARRGRASARRAATTRWSTPSSRWSRPASRASSPACGTASSRGAASGADAARQRADEPRRLARALRRPHPPQRIDRDATRRILGRILAGGDR